MQIRVVTEAPVEPRTPRWVFVVVGAVVLALLLAGAFWLGGRANQDPGPEPTPTHTPTATPSGTAEPSETPTATEPTPTQTGPALPEHMAVAGEVVPGLWQGTATVSTGNSNAIYGIPVGWSRTVDGAVAAAMNIDAAFYSLPAVVEDTQVELNPYLYTGEALESEVSGDQALEFRRQLREVCRLDESGVVVDAQGNPSQHETYYGGGIPRYGAYQVRDVEYADEITPQRVEVAVVQPVFSGPGTDTNMTEVLLMFRKSIYIMVWDGDDWRAEDWGVNDEPTGPWQTTVSNQGFAHLVTLVGQGWAVPADATQDPIPGAVLAK